MGPLLIGVDGVGIDAGAVRAGGEGALRAAGWAPGLNAVEADIDFCDGVGDARPYGKYGGVLACVSDSTARERSSAQLGCCASASAVGRRPDVLQKRASVTGGGSHAAGSGVDAGSHAAGSTLGLPRRGGHSPSTHRARW